MRTARSAFHVRAIHVMLSYRANNVRAKPKFVASPAAETV
jgi:hypothetical protein